MDIGILMILRLNGNKNTKKCQTALGDSDKSTNQKRSKCIRKKLVICKWGLMHPTKKHISPNGIPNAFQRRLNFIEILFFAVRRFEA